MLTLNFDTTNVSTMLAEFVESGNSFTSNFLASDSEEIYVSEFTSAVIQKLDKYEGPYEATPTQETQTFTTDNKAMEHNFIVNPIPHNYGLITWDGSTLTVS